MLTIEQYVVSGDWMPKKKKKNKKKSSDTDKLYRTELKLVNITKKVTEIVNIRYNQKEKRWYLDENPVSEEDLERVRDFLNKAYALGWLNKSEDV